MALFSEEKESIERIFFKFLLQLLSEMFVILRSIERDIINTCIHISSCKAPVILVRL